MKGLITILLALLLPPSLISQTEKPAKRTILLPEPQKAGQVSLEEALSDRRSLRTYTKEPLTLSELSQILWAAQGITGGGGLRTAPSAGALYPLEIYVVAASVEELPTGLYHYQPYLHKLTCKKEGDLRKELYNLALRQNAVLDAAACLVIAGVYERTTGKYGERGTRYVHMEAGHACQNVYLQATALGLGTVTIGAFQDDDVQKVLEMGGNVRPLSIMPIGKLR